MVYKTLLETWFDVAAYLSWLEYSVHTRLVAGSNPAAATIWPVGQEVKTPPFHGGIMGSIPVRVTKPQSSEMTQLRCF